MLRKLKKKINQRWRAWHFKRKDPYRAELRNLLKTAVKQGNICPVCRAKRGRYA